MPHEIEAFPRREELECDREQGDDLVEAAWSGGAEERFQFRKGEFDRIEIRTVRRQKPEAGAHAFDRGLHLRLFVHRQVVEDHDVARAQGGHEHLLDVREKGGIVDRPVEDCRRRQAVDAECRDNGLSLPMPTGGVIAETQPTRRAAISTQEIGGDPGFVDEHIGARIVQRQRVLPAAARRRHIRTPLFVGVYGFF